MCHLLNDSGAIMSFSGATRTLADLFAKIADLTSAFFDTQSVTKICQNSQSYINSIKPALSAFCGDRETHTLMLGRDRD